MLTGTVEKKKEQKGGVSLSMLFSEIEYGETELTAENLPEAWFQVIKTGKFYDFRYGEFKVDNSLLNEIKQNFDDNVLEVDVALDKGHMWGDGAFAWVSELQVKGNALWARFKDFTDDGTTALLSKKFKYFSIEFGPYEKPGKEQGKMDKFMNVLRGIAMTNRPVIKGMKDRPSFFSDSIYSLINNPNNMEVFKKLLSELSKKEKVSPSEFALLNTAFATLSEDEQAEVKEEVKEVEKTVEAPAAPAADAAADKDLADAKYADAKACMADMLKKGKDKMAAEKACNALFPKKASEAELSEIVTAQGTELAESRERIKTLEADAAARVLSERMGELMLSETNSNGFAKGIEDTVKKFVSKFSDAEYTDFKALLKGYRTIDTAILGDSVKPEGDLQAAFDKAVDDHIKANKSTYSDAMVAVRAARPEFKKLV